MYLTTKNLNPNRKSIVANFGTDLSDVLPSGYLHFIREYGTGTYGDEIYINFPDIQTISLTFGYDTDLWDFDDFYNVNDLLKSIHIGSTIDGDIICVTESRIGKIFVLPRHSASVLSFERFEDVINHFKSEDVSTYFDPDYEAEYEQFNLINSSEELIDITPIHNAFLKTFKHDFVMNENVQPKYFFKEFGGWIVFDLIYKNSIVVKFQESYFKSAYSIIQFLRRCINQ